MAFIFINESRSEQKTTYFDWWGSLTLGGMLSSLVLVLDQGPTWGWMASQSLLCYFVVIVLLGLFIRIEHRVKDPIVDLRFFKIPAFVNTLVNNFIVFMGMMGGLFLLPIFAQTFLGYTATQAGYLFMPMAAAMMLASPIGGMLTGKIESRYVIFASTVVAAIGIFLFSFLDPKSGALGIVIPLSIMAFGLGFGMAQRTNIIASVVDPHEIGIASSILALARNIAGAFGIAIFGTILTNRIYSNVLSINSFSTIHSNNPLDLSKFVGLIELKAQVNAYDYVFLVASAIVFIGAFAVLFMKVKNERTDIKVQVE
jgi:predicted MFS family arabinose efflux permease